MRATVTVRGPAGNHQHGWGGAFAEGLRRHGWNVHVGRDPRPGDRLVVFWGVRRAAEMAAVRASGAEVCVLERGYLGDRFAWTSVSFGGGLNGRAEFRGVRNDVARFRAHFADLMRPWRSVADGYALLVGQVEGDMSLAPLGGKLGRWYRRTAAALAEAGHDVRFRPHPVAVERGQRVALPGVPVLGGSLDDALRDAARVVTWNSNTAVDAVLAGVPTVACDEGSMAWAVTGREPLAAPPTPDRWAWAGRLAWCQWSRDEMRSGACWDAVGCR